MRGVTDEEIWARVRLEMANQGCLKEKKPEKKSRQFVELKEVYRTSSYKEMIREMRI